jgi:hypothetical protein
MKVQKLFILLFISTGFMLLSGCTALSGKETSGTAVSFSADLSGLRKTTGSSAVRSAETAGIYTVTAVLADTAGATVQTQAVAAADASVIITFTNIDVGLTGTVQLSVTDSGGTPVASGTSDVFTVQEGENAVTVVLRSSQKKLLSFGFETSLTATVNSVSTTIYAFITGAVDETSHTVSVKVPSEPSDCTSFPDFTKLAASFTTNSSATVSVGSIVQESGATVNDFTNPVTYTVKGADGSTQNYTVTVTPNSTDAVVIEYYNTVDSSLYYQIVPNGAAVTLVANRFTRTGYTFGGWSKSEAAGNTDYTDGGTYMITAALDTTDATDTVRFLPLYAVWTTTYTITLDSTGADSGSTGTTVLYGKYNNGFYTDAACTIACTSITVPTRTGYSFTGYYTASDGTGTQYITNDGTISATSTTFSADQTLYAVWTLGIYTITLDYTNTEFGIEGTTVLYEKYNTGFYTDAACTETFKCTSIMPPTKAGYHFYGYYTAAEGAGTLYITDDGTFISSDMTNTTFTANQTLYAYWREMM